MDHHIVTDVDTHMACTGCVIRSLEEGSGSFVFTEENKEEYQNGEMEENE